MSFLKLLQIFGRHFLTEPLQEVLHHILRAHRFFQFFLDPAHLLLNLLHKTFHFFLTHAGSVDLVEFFGLLFQLFHLLLSGLLAVCLLVEFFFLQMLHLLLGHPCDPLGVLERVVDLRVVVVAAGQLEAQIHDLEFRFRRQLLGIYGRLGAHDLIRQFLKTVIQPFGFLLCFCMMNRQCAGGRAVFIF